MKKSTVIAQCLVNSKMMGSLEHAEHAVKSIFAEEFPCQDFDLWNQGIDAATATHIISAVGLASKINVRKFIEDLW